MNSFICNWQCNRKCPSQLKVLFIIHRVFVMHKLKVKLTHIITDQFECSVPTWCHALTNAFSCFQTGTFPFKTLKVLDLKVSWNNWLLLLQLTWQLISSGKTTQRMHIPNKFCFTHLFQCHWSSIIKNSNSYFIFNLSNSEQC